jgi:uncharacterized membrane protein YeaQ/YmgE (transglycosylase-associated protein family)
MLLDILFWIALGIAAGSLAKYILPGPDPGGPGLTILLGIGGAFVGGFAGFFLPFLKSGASASISVGSIFTATVGAIVILVIHRAMKKS